MRRTARALSVAVLASAVLGVPAPAVSAEPGFSEETAVPVEPVDSAEPGVLVEPPVPAEPKDPVEPPVPADPAASTEPGAREEPGAAEGPAVQADPAVPADSAAPETDIPAEPPTAAEPAIPAEPPMAAEPPAGHEPAVSAGAPAEVRPSTVSPGGSVTVSVACEDADSDAPTSIDASSEAFEEGTVQLQKVAGEDEEKAGPAYRGTARIAPTGSGEEGADAGGKDSAWTVDGTCPAAHGGQGKPWSARFSEAHGGDAALQHGVRAGEGGAFTDSVPALVAGGLLIAGAVGAAAHRLIRREAGTDD